MCLSKPGGVIENKKSRLIYSDGISKIWFVLTTPNHDHLAECRYEHDDDVIVLFAFLYSFYDAKVVYDF